LTASGRASTRVLAILVGGAFEPTDVESLCAAACLLAATLPDGPLDLDVAGLVRSDLEAVDRLARIALAARRAGRSVRVIGATTELRELLALSGLTRAVPCAGAPSPGRSIEAGR